MLLHRAALRRQQKRDAQKQANLKLLFLRKLPSEYEHLENALECSNQFNRRTLRLAQSQRLTRFQVNQIIRANLTDFGGVE